MVKRSDSLYVAGETAPFRIQPPIVHPAFCECERCSRLSADEQPREHTFRILRNSPYPDDRIKSSIYAAQVKQDEERALRVGALAERRSGRLSLEQLCELYFEMNPRKVSEATIKRDRISARNLTRLIDSAIAPESIDEPIAVRYRNAREKETAAPRTILDELSFLKMVLTFGHRWKRETGMSGVNLIDIPDVGEWDPPGIAQTVEEFRAVYQVATPRERAMAVTGVTTMVRRGALMAFREDWTDLRRRWLTIPAEYMKKGRAKRRYPLEVPLSKWTVETLRKCAVSKSGYFWPNPHRDKPIVWTEHIFASLIERAGVRPFSAHDWRTTGATWLREAGIDELAIAILLGHRSTFDPEAETFHARSANVTRGYTKLFESSLREAVAVFDRIRRKVERRR